MAPSFVHLSVRTEYSLDSSLVKIPKLVDSVRERGMNSVAITDTNNLFGSIKHYKKSIDKGVKPIIAIEVNVRINPSSPEFTGKTILIAKNNDGYRHIIELLSDSYEDGNEATGRQPVIDINKLLKKREGVIVLSGGRKGPIGKLIKNQRYDDAKKLAHAFSHHFGQNFFIELQRTGHADDNQYVKKATEIAANLSIPVVATNPVLFLNYEEFKTHQLRVAIANKTDISEVDMHNSEGFSPEMYLKSPEEMADLFKDIPSAIENTVNIARACSIDIELGKNYLPAFPDAQKSKMSESEFLIQDSYKGLYERLEVSHDKNSENYQEELKKYEDRLKFELDVVVQMGFPGYFLIVSDFIKWSKEQNIPVGPGRGSGAGSLIAYSLKITDLDPLKYDLLFERFLNPERVSMPDFDVDFCMDRREEVIQYVADKYGHDAVSQIITYGTMAAKMVVKDVARALGFPYMMGERISRFIPATPGVKLKDALEENPDFQMAVQSDSDIKSIVDYALALEGMTRQTGKHAGGVLIAPGKLTDLTATYNEVDKDGRVINKVSQLDKNDVEEAGLVKFDFLGLKTLTIIQNAVDNINLKLDKEGKENVDITHIPLDDESVYELFQEGLTTAVFQVESKGMKDLLKKLRPDCFEDIIALVALYRPGPLESGMVDNFINRKHGREEISYPDPNYQHESLVEILKPTYGVILYQEQVMQIAQNLAGYTLGGADMLRRAMGKKKPEEMAKQRSVFKDGAINSGVDGDLAMKIFDLVEKFAGYGFNKSHSAAYALIAYQTAWLKKHYPSEYMAAVLSGDMDNQEKVVTYVNECERLGLKLLPPDVNKSKKSFQPVNEKELVFGLGAVKGIGETVIKKIIDSRATEGPYKTFFEFVSRVSPTKTVLESGIKSGLFDSMHNNRASLMSTYPRAQKVAKEAKTLLPQDVQQNIFGDLTLDETVVRYDDVDPWPLQTRLSYERIVLGLYLTGHPMRAYDTELSSVTTGKILDIIGSDMEVGSEIEGEAEKREEDSTVAWQDKSAIIAGVVMSMDIKNSKRGQRAFLVIDDGSRQLDVMIGDKALDKCQHMLEMDRPLIIQGRITMDKRTKRIRMFGNDVKSIDMIRERHAESIILDINPEELSIDQIERMKKSLDNQPEGYATIASRFENNGETNINTLDGYRVTITDNLLNEFRNIFGQESISVLYKEDVKSQGIEINKISKEDKQAKIAEGQQTFEQRAKEIALLFDAAEMAMN